MRLNDSKRYEEAINLATQLIHESPWIAEAWCQRGMANYHRGQYESAIRDCHQALEINPYHFTAAAGMGQCYLLQDNPVAALEAFRRALRLNPGHGRSPGAGGAAAAVAQRGLRSEESGFRVDAAEALSLACILNPAPFHRVC